MLFSDGASFHYYEAFPVKLLHTFQDYSGETNDQCATFVCVCNHWVYPVFYLSFYHNVHTLRTAKPQTEFIIHMQACKLWHSWTNMCTCTCTVELFTKPHLKSDLPIPQTLHTSLAYNIYTVYMCACTDSSCKFLFHSVRTRSSYVHVTSELRMGLTFVSRFILIVYCELCQVVLQFS